jgi:hypothetical protein
MCKTWDNLSSQGQNQHPGVSQGGIASKFDLLQRALGRHDHAHRRARRRFETKNALRFNAMARPGSLFKTRVFGRKTAKRLSRINNPICHHPTLAVGVNSNYGTSFTYRGNVTHSQTLNGIICMTQFNDLGVATTTTDGTGVVLSSSVTLATNLRGNIKKAAEKKFGK